MVKKRLKCWRKEVTQGDFVGYRNKKNKRNTVSIDSVKTLREGKIWSVDISHNSIKGKTFKTKAKASKFAKDYMKKHNVC